MYVEDESAPALLFQLTLEAHYPATQLFVARDPEEAIAYLRKQPPYESVARPDLVVLDLHLGVRSGLDLLENIRCDPEFASLPVVFFSSSRATSDYTRAQALGALDFIRKPIGLDEFETCVANIHSLTA